MLSKDPTSVRALRVLRFFVIGLIWLISVGGCVPVIIYVLPDFETAWFPPITDQKISNGHFRTDDNRFYLFNWSYIKARKAVPLYITFMAYRASDPQARFAVDTYVGWDCKRNFRSDRTALPSKQRLNREVCIRLPDDLAGKPDIRVDGVFDFDVGHGIYTVPVKVPPGPEANPSGTQSIPDPIAAPK